MPKHHYTVTYTPLNPYFDVTCRFWLDGPNGTLFLMPSWIPGSYLIRDFAKYVGKVTAKNEKGQLITIDKVAKNQWQLAPFVGEITLNYQVYAQNYSVRGAYISDTFAFFNGSSLFLLPGESDERPCLLSLVIPEGVQVATPLTEYTDSGSSNTFYAQNFEALIDAPVAMGELQITPFSIVTGHNATPIPHRFVIFGDFEPFDTQRLIQDLTKICTHHHQLFGKPSLQEPFTFLTLVTQKEHGGLEHRHACFQVCSREDLPVIGKEKQSNHYARFLELLSHEYWHQWLIKRIKPKAFSPYNLNVENYTKTLWIFEGITSYYDALSLSRSGVLSQEDYFKNFAEHLSRYFKTPGRNHQTLEEASFDAWIKFYQPGPHSQNDEISYYVKGAIVAFMLDMEIRLRSQHQKSLDSLMQALWQNAHRGEGIAEEAFELMAIALINDPTLKYFFDKTVRSTEAIVLEPYFEKLGIMLQFEESNAKEEPTFSDTPSLGITLSGPEDLPKISFINKAGPAFHAGLLPFDELVALNGFKIMKSKWENALSRYKVGESVLVQVFRDGALKSFNVVLGPKPKENCTLMQNPGITSAQIAFQNSWLGNKQ